MDKKGRPLAGKENKMKWEDLVKLMEATKCKQCDKYRYCRKQCEVEYNGCEDYQKKESASTGTT